MCFLGDCLLIETFCNTSSIAIGFSVVPLPNPKSLGPFNNGRLKCSINVSDGNDTLPQNQLLSCVLLVCILHCVTVCLGTIDSRNRKYKHKYKINVCHCTKCTICLCGYCYHLEGCCVNVLSLVAFVRKCLTFG